MGNENGTWVMHGLSVNDPGCLRTPEELISFVNEVGFLPLFANSVPGFSAEEHTEAGKWWSGDPERDPWEWREIIARSGKVAYGKFFDRKAGFVSKEWMPYFVNCRRSGYDFDALWDDEKASFRQKKIMDLFLTEKELFSYEIRQKAGFGKDGDKNFEGVLTDLQMSFYLCVRDFRQRTGKNGTPYGWPVAVCTTPEHLWGYDLIASGYGEAPEVSRERIRDRVRELWHGVTDKQLKIIG